MANPISDKLKIGTIGELLVQLRLLQYGVQAAPPLKDSGNDLIALKGGSIRCIQVKTTTKENVPRKPKPKINYHLLAIVHLVGENNELHLDQSKVYLLTRSERSNARLTRIKLENFKLDENRVMGLFTEQNPSCDAAPALTPGRPLSSTPMT